MRTSIVLLAGAIATGGCVFETRPPAPISGTYVIPGGCKLQVDEAGASADCADTKVDVRLSGGAVTVNRVALTRTEKNTECWDERTCTRTYTGSAERTARAAIAPDEGRLALLAGTWKGKLTRKIACTVEKPKANAPPYCKKSNKDITYTFQATIRAHDASVSWSSSDGGKGTFTARETKSGILVADVLYKRLAEGEGS